MVGLAASFAVHLIVASLVKQKSAYLMGLIAYMVAMVPFCATPTAMAEASAFYIAAWVVGGSVGKLIAAAK